MVRPEDSVEAGPRGATTGPVSAALCRRAVAYACLVAVLSAVGGLWAHDESQFLVAWTYTGAAVALPALLVNWMVARSELGSMPGGRAWMAGLLWVYVDGLGLLYITAQPQTPLRSVTVLAVLAPIGCFGVAAAQLTRHQEGRSLPALQVFGTAAGLMLVVGGLAAVALGASLAESEAAWLARPAALVAVTMTVGALTSARFQREVSPPARRLARIGLALLSVGALNAWLVMAQALSGFSLPASPLLVVQAVTMGLLLQVPIHAPRLAAPGSGLAGDEARARAPVEVVSQAWFAEDLAEDGVLPVRLRRPAIAYVAVTAPMLGIAGLVIDGRSAFLMAWVYVSAAYTTPAMVVTWVASRRTRYQVTPWRLWFAAVVALYLNGAGLLLTAVLPDSGIDRLATLAVVPCVALFGLAAVAMMRARSGSRALAVDVIETAMVTIVVGFGLLLCVGEEVWSGDEAWFTIPAALVTVAVTCGLAWTLTIFTRMPHENRDLEALGLALAVAGTVDAWAMLAQGLSGFTLPSAPLLFFQAVAMGLLLLLPLYVPRHAPKGLEQLPPHEQVRHGWTLVTATIVALPALFAVAWLARDARPWAPVGFTALLMALLFLATARQALSNSETRGLYAQVMHASDERRRLLAEVLRSVEGERQRFAVQLHEQAMASYAAFASLSQQAGQTHPRSGTILLTEASSRLRSDFGDQAESLRRIMLAMRPLEAGRAALLTDRLGPPIRAYVANLYGDAPAPTLHIDLRPDLTLSWTTEAILLRVVQEAIGNTHRHAHAHNISVAVDVDAASQVALTVSDDGVGFDPTTVTPKSGIATMRSFAALAGAEIVIEGRQGGGTTIRLHVTGHQGPEPASRPRLRLVPTTDS